MSPLQTEAPAPAPATLARRAAAFALDCVLIAAYLVALVAAGAALRLVLPSAADAVFGNPLVGELVGFAVLTLPVTLYFALSEASSAATWGKRRLGVRIIGVEGGRIGIGRSLARSALKFVPWELAHGVIWQFSVAGSKPPTILTVWLAVVWLLVGLNLVSVLVGARHRALYDRLAGTRVVRAEVLSPGAAGSRQ